LRVNGLRDGLEQGDGQLVGSGLVVANHPINGDAGLRVAGRPRIYGANRVPLGVGQRERGWFLCTEVANMQFV
jgi:hypothetical protein